MFAVAVGARVFKFLWCPYFCLPSKLWASLITLCTDTLRVAALLAVLHSYYTGGLCDKVKTWGEEVFYNLTIKSQAFVGLCP